MRMSLFLIILIINSVLASTTGFISPSDHDHVSDIFDSDIDRSSFPEDFIFGTSASAYQYEGEAKGDGKGPSIWDTFTHKYPERITGGANGDVAVDFYHRYKEDVNLMKELGVDAHRLSISWARILPRGKVSGGVNREGIDFYNNLINQLMQNGIRPFITLYHWDAPQVLEEEYGGFLSTAIIEDFRDFAEVCFKEFGDRVKYWITLNEPTTFSSTGYAIGTNAPGRCSSWVSGDCQAGNSATEPYIVGHHLLLSHAAAANLYKQKYQESQRGSIGITLNCIWMIPYSNTTADIEASLRALDFMFGWYMDPLTYGEYPLSMRNLVKERLPTFSKTESEMVKGSFDFIGINYYTTYYAYNVSPNLVNISYSTDSLAGITGVRNGIPIGPVDGTGYIYAHPKGFQDLLIYIKNKYNNPTIYITENGIDEFNNVTLPLEKALEDPMRIWYHREHLKFLLSTIRKGVKVKGYFAWSLLDNMEWNFGYTVRFGIYFVDYKDGLKRFPKSSVAWFKRFLNKATAIL